MEFSRGLTCPYNVSTLPVMSSVKTAGWTFRVEPDADELVREAAKVSHSSLTDFVVGAAVSKAEHVVADRTRFLLDPEEWRRVCKILDRPVQQKPALTKLLEEPGVFG
jgi:uncharacterized protein (DUF1778 family)